MTVSPIPAAETVCLRVLNELPRTRIALRPYGADVTEITTPAIRARGSREWIVILTPRVDGVHVTAAGAHGRRRVAQGRTPPPLRSTVIDYPMAGKELNGSALHAAINAAVSAALAFLAGAKRLSTTRR